MGGWWFVERWCVLKVVVCEKVVVCDGWFVGE